MTTQTTVPKAERISKGPTGDFRVRSSDGKTRYVVSLGWRGEPARISVTNCTCDGWTFNQNRGGCRHAHEVLIALYYEGCRVIYGTDFMIAVVKTVLREAGQSGDTSKAIALYDDLRGLIDQYNEEKRKPVGQRAWDRKPTLSALNDEPPALFEGLDDEDWATLFQGSRTGKAGDV